MFLQLLQQMFLILMGKVLKRQFELNEINDTKSCPKIQKIKVNIAIYETKQEDYPSCADEWDSYHGILIPGSFSTAYEDATTPWIRRLAREIQEEIHAKARKTIGICFGHQLFAHSFGEGGVRTPNANVSKKMQRKYIAEKCNRKHDLGSGDGCEDGDDKNDASNVEGGRAIACPKGTQVGKISFLTSQAGEYLLRPNNPGVVTLYYTHGDMVHSLPSCAVCLGGSTSVPIQSAAYFASTADAHRFLHELNDGNSGIKRIREDCATMPYAFSFQAHLEMASDFGLSGTFTNILNVFEEKGVLPKEILEASRKEAVASFPRVERDSVDMMLQISSVLGWI